MRRKGMICDRPRAVCMRNLWQKAERETGTNSCTRCSNEGLASRKRVICARNIGTHVRRGTQRTKGIKKRDEKLGSRTAEKGANTSK